MQQLESGPGQLQVLSCVQRGHFSSVYRVHSRSAASPGGHLQALKLLPCPADGQESSTDNRCGRRPPKYVPDWDNELRVYQRLTGVSANATLHRNIRPLLAHWFLRPGHDRTLDNTLDSDTPLASKQHAGQLQCSRRSLCMLFPWLPCSLADLLHWIKPPDVHVCASAVISEQNNGSCPDGRTGRHLPQRQENYQAKAAGSPPAVLQMLGTDSGKWQCIHMLLSALDFLHQHSIVHRDIKPSNLLVDSQGVLQVADFGLARHLPATDLSSTAGTRQYRAPEMLFGSRDYDCQVDMWACGCVCFEILSGGRMLFDCATDSDVAQLALVVSLLGDPLTSGRGWPQLRLLPDYGKITFATPLATPAPQSTGSAYSFFRVTLSAHSGPHCRCLNGESAVQLLEQLIVYNPDHRSSAQAALQLVVRARASAVACSQL